VRELYRVCAGAGEAREDFFAYVRGRVCPCAGARGFFRVCAGAREHARFLRAFAGVHFFRVRVGRESRTSHHQEEIFGIKSGKNYSRVRVRAGAGGHAKRLGILAICFGDSTYLSK